MSNFFSRPRVEDTKIDSSRSDTTTGEEAGIDFLNTLNNGKIRFKKVSEKSPSEALSRGLSDLEETMLLGQQAIEEIKNTENGMSPPTYKIVIS